MEINKIYCGHILDILSMLPANSVDCVVTSPPYWQLRKYNTVPQVWGGDKNCVHNFENNICINCKAWLGELGQEPNPDMYITNLLIVFREIKRILKNTGTLWVNIGDCYGGNSSFIPSGRQGFGARRTEIIKKNKSKCLLMIPEKFAIRMVDELGFILRNKIIWYKPNAIPSSVKDRFKSTWEYIYFFVKNKKYYFDLNAVRKPLEESLIQRVKYSDRNKIIVNKSEYRDKTKDESYKNGIKLPPEPDEPEYIIRRFFYKNEDKWICYDCGKDMEQHKCDEGSGTFYYNGVWIKGCREIGKNPGDVWDIPLSPKYLIQDGHTNRQGLNRPLDTVTIKAYKDYKQPIAKYLKSYIKKEHISKLDEIFGKHKWRHWIRTDLSGAALPGPDDWFKLKEILNFDDKFDNLIYEIEKLNVPVFMPGTNPGDMWNIPTMPFSAKKFIPDINTDHFAVFPEKLIERVILAGCPEYVCIECGRVKTKNYNCDCGKGYEKGIVLDPFVGSGTTAVVAKRLGRGYIGIDINPDYCRIAEARLEKTKFEKQEELF